MFMTDFAEIHPFRQLTAAQIFNSFRQLSDHIWSSDVREDFSSEARKCFDFRECFVLLSLFITQFHMLSRARNAASKGTSLVMRKI